MCKICTRLFAFSFAFVLVQEPHSYPTRHHQTRCFAIVSREVEQRRGRRDRPAGPDRSSCRYGGQLDDGIIAQRNLICCSSSCSSSVRGSIQARAHRGGFCGPTRSLHRGPASKQSLMNCRPSSKMDMAPELRSDSHCLLVIGFGRCIVIFGKLPSK